MANNIFDDLIKDVEKLIKKHERGVKEDYKAAYRRLRNKLQKIYADYENDEEIKLTRAELRKLDVDTAKIMAEMYKENETAVQNMLESILNASYKSVNTITSKYNIEAVKRKIDANNIIKKQVAGHIWTERIKKYGNDFVYDVHGIIHQGLDNGDTYTTTARKLKERFGKDIGNTMRIARTESARVLEDSKYQAFEDLANNDSVQVFKIWHTMGDEAVRDTHDAMEGVKVAYDEDFVLPSGAKCQYPKGTGVAAEDINCRCYVEYVTELVKDDKSLEKIAKIGYNEDEEERPDTLKNFELYSQMWEDEVVKKQITKEEINCIGDNIQKIIDENEYSMRVRADILDKILVDGRFKNQFETNTSGGLLDLEARKEASEQLFGNFGLNIEGKDREKYGYLGLKDFIKDDRTSFTSQYGNCIIHFDKNKLKNRVTYTIEDSLEPASGKIIIAGNAENARANGIRTTWLKSTVGMFKNNKDITLDDFLSNAGSDYFELQYHGQVRTDAIKEICFVNKYGDDLSAMVNIEIVDKLKEMNIKVYEMIDDFGGEKIVEL
jgi:hypothetical protein